MITSVRLGIDMDGVICDFNAGWMELHKVEFGSDLRPEMVVTWDNLHELGGFADMDAFWRWARGSDERPSIFRHLEPYPDALETMHRAARRRPSGRDRHGQAPMGHPRHAALDRRPRACRRARSTSPTASHTVACDVYLDDSPLVLPDLVATAPRRPVYRMVRPWNVAGDGRRRRGRLGGFRSW